MDNAHEANREADRSNWSTDEHDRTRTTGISDDYDSLHGKTQH